jgi:hypothetical protein
MCKHVGINPSIVEININNTGGAQFILKNVTWHYFAECEQSCYILYIYLDTYMKMYPIDNHIQKWTCDMWILLWCIWKLGKKTITHSSLDFSWATDSLDIYNKLNIFHLAGINEANCQGKFCKFNYKNYNVMIEYKKNPSIFNHISTNTATYGYVQVIKEYSINYIY